MEAKEFITTLEKMNFSLSVRDGKLNLKGDRRKLSKEEIEAIKSNTEVINYITTNKDKLIAYISTFHETPFPKKSEDIISIYRLSGLQQGMLFHSLYEEGSGSYIEQLCCDLTDVNIKAFLASWSVVIKHHTILRSAFYYDSFSVPVQCVFRDAELPLEELDFRWMDETSQTAALKNFEEEDRAKGFDFKSVPLMRLGLIRLSESRYRMVWTSHHILFDGWSFPVLMEEFLTTYELLISGKPIPQVEEDRYEDYIRYLEQKDKEAEESYWRSYLNGINHGTLLPFISITTDRTKGIGSYQLQYIVLNKSKTSQIQAYVQSKGLTVNTLMQGVWAWLLHRYTGDNEIVYGVVVSGRPDELAAVEQRVGMYINTLALKAEFSGNQNTLNWLKGLQADQVSSRQYQYTALQDVQKWAGIKGDIFDNILVFENYPVSKLVASGSWSLQVGNVETTEQTNYPLTLTITNAEELSISFSYNTDLLQQDYVTAIRDQFEEVLFQMVDERAVKLNNIRLLTTSQEQQLREEFNNTKVVYPKNNNLIDLFEEQALNNAGAIALIFEGEQLSYGELNKRSNQLAHFLQRKGVEREALVPICMERSIEMIVGILGILKAGAAYVPIDPEYPADRISYMLEDTGTEFVISSSGSRERLNASNATVIELDGSREQIDNERDNNPAVTINPEQLAYVIYTSGSTGRPKGVMIEHQSLINYCLTFKNYYSIIDKDKILQQSSVSFDTMVEELYPALISGASIIIVKEGGKDVYAIKDYIENENVSILSTTPTVIEWLNSELATTNKLRYVISGGEVLPPHFINKLCSSVQVVNTYGPSETTVCVAYNRIDDVANSSLIGKPVSNTQLYILNGNKELCPVGVSGEICAGGVQLARGYLNNPALTAEKFITDPFSKEAGARLYRTGDLGRWLPDGNIEYLGRIDDQVKIRGYRIELGEIENVLNQSKMVNQAVVLAKEDNNGKKQLAGYIVPKGVLDKQELRNYLTAKLPEYMIPVIWVELEQLPLTPNGKIDRKALSDSEAAEMIVEYVAPRNATEEVLAKIWTELLGAEYVGVNDNFFELGGHSLLAMRAVSAIRKELNIEVAIKNLFEYPTISSLTAYLALNSGGVILPAIEAVHPRPEYIPLSFSQERLWFIDRLEGSVQYHLPAVLRLRGELKIEILEHTLRAIISRHEVLRTVIKEHDGQGYQQIKEADNWKLEITDDIDGENTEDLSSYIASLVNKPFDLSADYMLRGALIRIDEDQHILVVTIHHIASDGWSVSILVKEVVEIYEAYVEGREPNLASLPIQYADFAIWRRKYMSGVVLENKLAYWKEKLEDVAPLQLPLDYSRPTIFRLRGATHSFHIDEELTARLYLLSQQQGATLYMTLLTALKVLLYRYSGQEDICVGTTVAGRTEYDLEELIGFFVNTLALRSQIKGNMSFNALLQQVKTTTIEAYSHQEVPFEKVVDAVVKGRDMSRHPLFQVLFTLQNTPETPELKLGSLNLTTESQEQNTSRFDLAFTMSETSTGIQGTVEYNTDLFCEARIQRMTEHLRELLGSAVSSPNTAAGCLEILTIDEQEKLLDYGRSVCFHPAEATVAGLFEAQALEFPEQDAAVFAGKSITYKDLNETANKLAHELRRLGVKENTLVPLYAERGLGMLIGILGILKAGGAYVPIDTDFQGERVNYMLKDIGASVAVSSSKNSGLLQSLSSNYLKIVEVDSIETDEFILANPIRSLKPEHLAYVIYTSGSTGKPKGVQVSHRNLVDYVYGLNERTGISNCRSYALVSTIATDLGNTVLYSSLLFGGTLHVFTRETVSHIEELHEYFSKHRIDCLKIVPSHWKALSPEDGAPLLPQLMLIFGGEAFPLDQVQRIHRYCGDCRIFNHYGPTETTIGKLVYELGDEAQEDFKIPIGRPFSNTTVYVLSKERMLCPIGVPGELYIAGSGLARGYLNREDLTVDMFVVDTRGGEAAKMYRTGDLVLYQPDGNIQFIGRVDDQVKIRGYRVEPGEVERILEESELVKQAVVISRAEKQDDMQLLGYIVPNGPYDRAGIQTYLKKRLPDYMMPAYLVELKSLPLTANGKIDRKALPNPDGASLEGKYIAPRNETEAKLVEIWQELLGLERVGIFDNFFEIGGHSLLAMRVASVIRKELNIEVSIRDLFVYSTIAGLATYLDKQNKGSLLPAIIPGERPEYIPLSFSQERLWFIDRLDGSIQYHVPAVLRLQGELNLGILERTLRDIIQRHEVLRTVIFEQNGYGYQRIMSADNWTLGVIEELAGDEVRLVSIISDLINKPFDLSADYMLRADLIKFNSQDHILVVTMHHISSDGWSRSILVNEVITIYKGYTEGVKAELPLLPVQYADYAIWQRENINGEFLDKKLAYWKSKLEGVTSLYLPTDYSRPRIQSSRGAIYSFKIDQSLSVQLQVLSLQQGITLYMTMLSTFKVLLYRYSGQEDICIGAPIMGRSHRDLEGLIGFFINTLALRSHLSGDMTFSELLEEVKITTLEAYSHQEVPFEKVVDAVVKTRDTSRNPLFQVLFALQNTPDAPELKLGGLRLSDENQEQTTTLFDMAFTMSETSSGIMGTVEYSTDLYKEETIEKMVNHYFNLLGSVCALPGNKIGRLAMLSPVEEQQLLTEFNNTDVNYPTDKNVVDLFEEQVKKKPEAIAIAFGDEELSYDELNRRSNQLARYLQLRGVKIETPVPVCLERSIEMIISILAILKAGGAYVPIDPAYPADRISYMLEDTDAELVLSNSRHREKLNDCNISVIELDIDLKQIDREKTSSPLTGIGPDHLAYLIYTSGSTGKPKGVMIEHQSLSNLVAWHNKEYEVTKASNATSMSSVGFDAFGWEIWPYLAAGASILIIDDETRLSAPALRELFIDRHITHSFISTALVPEFIYASRGRRTGSLKYLLTGGDKLSILSLDGISYHLVNNYGPTENTVVATKHIVSKQDKVPPIGKPIWNTRIYILNEDKALNPVGIAGEICIGGWGLARGYLNRPELTAEKFVKDPFNKEAGARLYKTGDLGRWLPDGNIEYLGRMDDQVKIRGYRIELGEIESVLNQNGRVQQGVVLAKEDTSGNKRLVAYVATAAGMFDKQLLKEYLSSKLPDYMVPGVWMELQQMPLTASGKIDRKALPDPDSKDMAAEYVAPRNAIEQDIANIWQEMLVIKQVGINDNFFELGGHSLLAMRVISAIRRKLDVELSIKDLFVYPTVAGLNSQLESQNKTKSQLLIPIKETGNKIPLYIICGAGGTVFRFIDFVKLLDIEQPVYGLQQPMNGIELENFPNTIAGIAEKYVNEIVKENPNGPYALSGHCLGGNIAFEMAKQFRDMGKEVVMLSMFDAYATEEEEIAPASFRNYFLIPKIIKNSLSIISLKVGFELFLLLKHPKQALLYKIEKVQSRIGIFEPTPENLEMESFNKTSKIFETAIDEYNMGYYDGEVLTFYAKEHYYFIDRNKQIIYKRINISSSTKNSWNQHAKYVKTYEIEGEHSTIFSLEYATGLAKILQQHLDNANSNKTKDRKDN
ncbi:MAG TPA: amino acid adenylation domain-containing protein [Mucilaginibacter sp.]|jgi:amino acid adenylation domain-containing protein